MADLLGCGGGDDDNLTISADIFFKILDEEDPAAAPQPPLHFDLDLDLDLDLEGTLEGFDQGRQSCGLVNCEDTFRPQADMLGSKQYTEDGWKAGTVQQDPSDCMDQLGYHSDDWLKLSNSENNTFLDSVIDDFDCPEFDNNMQPSVSSNGSAEMTGFYYPTDANLVNGLYLDSNQERYSVKMGGENSFQGGSEEPESEVINDYSVFMPQNGRDSSQNILTQTCFGGLVHADMKNTTMSDSIIQEINESAALSTSSPWVADITLPDIIYTKAENGDTSDAIFNASNRCPTLRRTMLHTRYGEAQQLHNSGLVSDFKLGTEEEYLRTGIPMVSIMDLDEPLPRILSAEQNYSKDMRFHNESSTDSSPVPSSRYSTSESVDRAVFNTAKRSVPASKTILPGKKQKILSTDSKEDLICVSQHKQRGLPLSNETFKWNNSKSISSSDDDADICILDDISGPARPPAPPDKRKLHSLLQRPECSDLYSHGPGVLRADDLQRALQDVSEPTVESSPPDGVLAVPLLRHQRIALSWMVQKETAGRFCSGGILADDQGLGKTISTIALILTERSPPFRSCSMIQKSDQLEALNVDDEDDGGGSASDVKVMNQLQNSSTAMTGRPIKRESPAMVVKGRPAAGTLVVCPTSVIRQWADEIQNKVTRKANLSFLMYYGSNRTKDPNELAKYDVVITTYAIVSMEVPKQPLNDKDDEEKGKADASVPHDGLSTNKKKKNSSNSKSKNQDSSLLDAAARPLARVGWFRVILDEAQSIKNYRTLVARACWGLRAKRRWCLSGTPIQNAVDDLYSYFRFLRYEKLDVYKSFISDIKIPINRNPTTGYKKLQLVLKTIMLRRTKGTLLDGKPIINLPPKTITLKKVEFSEEERAFYSTLEAESQEQFKEYAAAGTVKQNYVNILLMLLRLRQACDHPLLVKAYGSNSIGKSSMDMVKKLPRDKQINLLNCLEACSAICTICNDPPEDAVVTICGHVFCNQCICEHLTADDNICPSAHCKFRLTVDSVFSRDTLKGCLSGQSEHDSYPCDPVPHLVKLETAGKNLFSDSSKMKAALEILQSLPVLKSVDTISRSSLDRDRKCLDSCKSSNAPATEKAIVFSQWTKMLDLFEVPLKDACIQYRRLDGTMSVAARDKAVKDFNTLPEVTVMIMSLKAASLGLNMIAACHVLLLDLWWNPTTEDQAIDRAHRIGQTRPVTVSRLTVNNTVEDRILGLQEKKRKMVASAFGEDEAGSRHSRLTVEELKYLFMA